MICMSPRRGGRKVRTACTDHLPNGDTNAREDTMGMQGVEKRETFAQNVVLLHISMPIRRCLSTYSTLQKRKGQELGGA